MTYCKYFSCIDFVPVLYQFYGPYFREDSYQALSALYKVLYIVDLGKGQIQLSACG